MKHPFFHKAVTEAYSGLIGVDCIPSYFIYFTVDPSLIDINIHPTKTEIKFQGKCGGYNLDWAWKSGYTAGMNASLSLSE